MDTQVILCVLHNIYRSEDSEIYVVHSCMGKISDAFYLTIDEVSQYFFNEELINLNILRMIFWKKTTKLK